MKRKFTKKPVLANTRTRISQLQDRIEYLEHKIATCTDEDRCIDLQQDLLEAKDNLRFAWADDEEEYNYAREQREFNSDGSLKYYGVDAATQERGTTKTYRNNRNSNKYIEVKKGNDGHSYARQYMEWDTPEGTVKNYTGAKDPKKGRYSRARLDTIDQMLDDYDEVTSAEYVDTNGMLGDPGAIWTDSDLRRMWSELHDFDKSMKYFDNYDEWLATTMEWLTEI